MIEYLRGRLLKKEDDHALVDVGGVGYGVDMPASTRRVLPGLGEAVEFHVFLYAQETILRLYGFATEREKELFEIFLGAQGIGPRTALGILSSIEVDAFASAILLGDIATLTKIPGIGKKTAERLIVELRQKMKGYATAVSARGGAGADAGAEDGAGTAEMMIGRGTAAAEAVEALEALGVKPVVAERAIQKAVEVLGREASVPDLVREGLKHRR